MRAGEIKILILKSWVNGILEGLRGMCSGTGQRYSVSMITPQPGICYRAYLVPQWNKGLWGTDVKATSSICQEGSSKAEQT